MAAATRLCEGTLRAEGPCAAKDEVDPGEGHVTWHLSLRNTHVLCCVGDVAHREIFIAVSLILEKTGNVSKIHQTKEMFK